MGFSIRRYLLAVLSRKDVGIGQLDWKYLRHSYSQHGEDLIAQALLPQTPGFYVDVGAFHPFTLSNTYHFYRKNWNGIAVEPNPKMARLFKSKRPRDTVVECAADETEGKAVFEIPDSGPAAHLQGRGTVDVGKTIQSIEVSRRRLDSILREHLPAGQTIDFMTTDCEGNDFSVLRSNDWERFRPRVLAVEDWEAELESRIIRFLEKTGYRHVITAYNTRFFALRDDGH